jgi:hypothetical protein
VEPLADGTDRRRVLIANEREHRLARLAPVRAEQLRMNV